MQNFKQRSSINGGENNELYDWDSNDMKRFNVIPTDYMYIMSCSRSEDGFKFSQGGIVPYGDLHINPASGVVNYGQGLYEGLKAYRGDHNEIRIFRVELNAVRMQEGAERLCMPSPSVQQFVDAIKQTVLANKRWIPPHGKGSLYLRPLLMGTGPSLGIGPAPNYTFVIYTSPVGAYAKGPFHFLVEDNVHRAIAGGTGAIKSITNYSPVYKICSEANAKGFSDVLFLDAHTGKFVEEGSRCNIFIVKGNVISTPPLNGTILGGITRKSIIEIAVDFGYQVEERPISIEELMDSDEVFCTGTVMVVKPVTSVTYRGKRVEYKTEGATTTFKKLHDTLVGIQSGVIEDKKGWTTKIS